MEWNGRAKCSVRSYWKCVAQSNCNCCRCCYSCVNQHSLAKVSNKWEMAHKKPLPTLRHLSKFVYVAYLQAAPLKSNSNKYNRTATEAAKWLFDCVCVCLCVNV